ncbi:MAG TPA: vitamin K epoxide reductase family protein [Candidatus Sulfotelmatobacter sp.]|nr:vitamin K epoxide reductase family protein [Candidatus Sulfotelmatobacter sp.]
MSALPRGRRALFLVITILSLAGMIDSGIAFQRHFAKSATTYCDFSQKFSCDIVNRSEYSTILGIPVALIGVVGYAVLAVLSTAQKSHLATVNRILIAALAGLTFALYLTYVEAYLLNTWCILCLISLALIFLISGVAVVLKLRRGEA